MVAGREEEEQMRDKACGCVVLVALLLFCLSVWLYVRINFPTKHYSDDELYSFAKECMVNKVGVKQFNEELAEVFKSPSNVGWSCKAPEGSCLDKVVWELPGTPLSWWPVSFSGKKAIALRFGCHFNYAYLVVVDPSESISSDNQKVRSIAGNIAVVHDYQMIIHYHQGRDDDKWPWKVSSGENVKP